MSKALMAVRLTAGVVVVAFMGFGLYVHILDGRAESMAQMAFELSEEQKPPTLAELENLYGGSLTASGCAGSDCSYTVTLSNRFLAALHVVPYTELKSYFWLRDGSLVTHMLDYTTVVEHHYSVIAHVQTDFCGTCQAFAIDPWAGVAPSKANGLVSVGNKTPASSKRTVFSLNTRCLTRRGCVSVADLLPTVWAKTADERITCRIQTDKGWVEKPVGWQ